MTEQLTRQQAEEAAWRHTAWRIDQTDLDNLLDRLHPDGTIGPDPETLRLRKEAHTLREEAHTQLIQAAGKLGAAQRRAEAMIRDAQRIADTARQETAAAPPTGPAPAPGTLVQQADGGIWMYLGTPTTHHPTPAAPRQAPSSQHRQCTKCGQTKDLHTGFHRDAKAAGGRKRICRTCDAHRKRAATRREQP